MGDEQRASTETPSWWERLRERVRWPSGPSGAEPTEVQQAAHDAALAATARALDTDEVTEIIEAYDAAMDRMAQEGRANVRARLRLNIEMHHATTNRMLALHDHNRNETEDK